MGKKLPLVLILISAFWVVGPQSVSARFDGWTSVGGERPEHKKRFKSARQVVRWINDYKKDPTPENVPNAIHTLARSGAFDDLDEAGLYIGFLAGVLADNQIEARQLITDLFPMSPKNQAVVILAIAYSGLPEWRQLMSEFTERMPQRTVLINSFMFGNKKTLLEAPLDQDPHMIDALWGYYIATGYLQPVERILKTLHWSGETQKPQHFALAHMAMWTLTANAERDRPLLRFYRTQLSLQADEGAQALKKVISSAERFEAAKMKKSVIAAIAAQKRQPSGKVSKWAWSAKAGETLLSIGCVAATALGQAEIAAPCIVTGAIYAGVRKLIFENK